MPVKLVEVKDIPRKRFTGVKYYEQFPEWHDVKEILAMGLKPFEAVEVTMSQEMIKSGKNAASNFALNLRRHCKKLHLDYDIRHTGDKSNGKIYLIGR